MVLPIYAYGQPVLKKSGTTIDSSYPELKSLIENMWETMYNAHGVGLAAPQIGLPIRLFMVDTIQLQEEGEEVVQTGIKKVFINSEKLAEGGEPYNYEEGCLSIPEVRGDVERPAQVKLRYWDENFQEHTQVFTGINARVIQHEYDHVDGKLFTELLRPIKRRLIKRKLEQIRKGNIKPEYRMKFYRSK